MARACPCGCGYSFPELELFDGAGAAVNGWVESMGLTLAEVRARDARPGMVAIRREISHYLRRHGWSTPRIGAFLGRDHTTILHALEGPPRQAIG